jgi:glycosyltransferase involved in cell wall biosynthesis
MRLALLTEIPAPFRIAQWNALSATSDLDVRVLLLGERDPRRSYVPNRDDWRFDARLLAGRDLSVGGRWLVVSRGVRRQLDSFRPHVILVGGWNQPAFHQAARYASRAQVPLVVWTESTARDQRSGLLPLELLKRRIVASASAFVVPGRAALEYVESFGVPAQRIVVAPNSVDPSIRERIEAARATRAELRRKLEIDGCCYLCVSRLSPEKGVDVLLRAFSGVPAGELAVIGGGPEETTLRRLAGPAVRLLGAVSQEELAQWYAAADVFVLASRSETWGMVLSEAAVAGLTLVTSEAPGAAYDLVEPGVNGFRVPVGDEMALRDALVAAAADEALRSRAASRSRELVAQATPENWAAAVAQLVRSL